MPLHHSSIIDILMITGAAAITATMHLESFEICRPLHASSVRAVFDARPRDLDKCKADEARQLSRRNLYGNIAQAGEPSMPR